MKRFLQALALAALIPAYSFAQIDLQTIATVELIRTEFISVKQLKAEVKKAETQAKRTITVAERRKVLDTMINERLVMQAAERDKISVTEAEINAPLQQARTGMNTQLKRTTTDKEFEDAVKLETGMGLVDYKAQLRKQLTIQKYLFSKKKAYFESIAAPTEADINNAYELSKSKLVRPDTVRFSMIFIPKGEGADAQKKSRALADKLVADIGTNPSRFDEASVRAGAPNSGYQAGDGGYLPKATESVQVVGSEFLNVAFSLKVGEVSRLLENPRGFQIIKVTETYAQKTLELNDVYQLGARGSLKEYIANQLSQEIQQRAIDTASGELLNELRAGKSFKIDEKLLNW